MSLPVITLGFARLPEGYFARFQPDSGLTVGDTARKAGVANVNAYLKARNGGGDVTLSDMEETLGAKGDASLTDDEYAKVAGIYASAITTDDKARLAINGRTVNLFDPAAWTNANVATAFYTDLQQSVKWMVEQAGRSRSS